jgi:hypothetical protein
MAANIAEYFLFRASKRPEANFRRRRPPNVAAAAFCSSLADMVGW